MLAAITDVVVLAVQLGRWPQPWELQRIARLGSAVDAASATLRTLATSTSTTVGAAAEQAVVVTGGLEPQMIASQLPAGERAAALQSFTSRIVPSALDAIVMRATGQITATTWPLAGAATEAMRRQLITGVAAGNSPRETARLMLSRVEGEFNGGLARALNIARTETLDAYRLASKYAQGANRDVLGGWRWSASLDRRCCGSCWGMHGTLHPVDELGPLDHQSGRCARVPEVLPWSALGIDLPEPPSIFPDATERFQALSRADQLGIVGPGRLALLDAGHITLSDLPKLRPNEAWRASYVPAPVSALTRLAASRERVSI